MSLKVLKPGLLASIQDLGRYGFQKYGVVVGGAMDALSLRLANLLVGNKEGEAAIEITMMGTSFQFEKESWIAITGGNLSPHINGQRVPMWRPVMVRKGTVLDFKNCRSGCRAYVAIAGGLAVSQVMNSRSTYLRGAIGGYKGRALKTGDRLLFNPPTTCFSSLAETSSLPFASVNWRIPIDHIINRKQIPIVRVIKGAEFDKFSPE
ncbi:MAG TPA: biotin-dependent carboxyltransferase family protein, partial [Pseudobacillus sp.]